MNFFELLNATNDEIVILDTAVETCCPFCGKRHYVDVNEQDYFDWQNGKSAQDAFPYLSADEREALISGICPACWENTFSTFDDAEEAFGEDITEGDVGEVLDDLANPYDEEEPSEEVQFDPNDLAMFKALLKALGVDE